MLKLGLAGAVLAVAMACAGQAGATIMEITARGDWNDGQIDYSGWTYDATYDTADLTITPWTDPDGFAGRMITLPTLTESVVLHGLTQPSFRYCEYKPCLTFTPIPDAVLNLSGPLTVFESGNAFVLETGDGYVGTSYSSGGARFPLIDITQPGSYYTNMYNYLVGTWSFEGGEQWTDSITITALPEPATWAMMILGFIGLGSALRMRRRFTA